MQLDPVGARQYRRCAFPYSSGVLGRPEIAVERAISLRSQATATEDRADRVPCGHDIPQKFGRFGEVRIRAREHDPVHGFDRIRAVRRTLDGQQVAVQRIRVTGLAVLVDRPAVHIDDQAAAFLVGPPGDRGARS